MPEALRDMRQYLSVWEKFAHSSAHPGKESFVRRPMTKRGLIVLEYIAVGLAGMLCLELHFATRAPQGQPQQAAWGAAEISHSPALSVAMAQPTVSTRRNIILSRPLFAQTRRPPHVQILTAPADMPRLSGIMVTPTERIAVFSPATGAPIIVNQNGRFGPFTVLAIAVDSVTMKGPGGVIVLRSDPSYLGEPEIAAGTSRVLAGGIYLNLIKVKLPNAGN
jgi:hypothetical protein